MPSPIPAHQDNTPPMYEADEGPISAEEAKILQAEIDKTRTKDAGPLLAVKSLFGTSQDEAS